MSRYFTLIISLTLTLSIINNQQNDPFQQTQLKTIAYPLVKQESSFSLFSLQDQKLIKKNQLTYLLKVKEHFWQKFDDVLVVNSPQFTEIWDKYLTVLKRNDLIDETFKLFLNNLWKIFLLQNPNVAFESKIPIRMTKTSMKQLLKTRFKNFQRNDQNYDQLSNWKIINFKSVDGLLFKLNEEFEAIKKIQQANYISTKIDFLRHIFNSLLFFVKNRKNHAESTIAQKHVNRFFRELRFLKWCNQREIRFIQFLFQKRFNEFKSVDKTVANLLELVELVHKNNQIRECLDNIHEKSRFSTADDLGLLLSDSKNVYAIDSHKFNIMVNYFNYFKDRTPSFPESIARSLKETFFPQFIKQRKLFESFKKFANSIGVNINNESIPTAKFYTDELKYLGLVNDQDNQLLISILKGLVNVQKERNLSKFSNERVKKIMEDFAMSSKDEQIVISTPYDPSFRINFQTNVNKARIDPQTIKLIQTPNGPVEMLSFKKKDTSLKDIWKYVDTSTPLFIGFLHNILNINQNYAITSRVYPKKYWARFLQFKNFLPAKAIPFHVNVLLKLIRPFKTIKGLYHIKRVLGRYSEFFKFKADEKRYFGKLFLRLLIPTYRFKRRINLCAAFAKYRDKRMRSINSTSKIQFGYFLNGLKLVRKSKKDALIFGKGKDVDLKITSKAGGSKLNELLSISNNFRKKSDVKICGMLAKMKDKPSLLSKSFMRINSNLFNQASPKLQNKIFKTGLVIGRYREPVEVSTFTKYKIAQIVGIFNLFRRKRIEQKIEMQLWKLLDKPLPFKKIVNLIRFSTNSKQKTTKEQKLAFKFILGRITDNSDSNSKLFTKYLLTTLLFNLDILRKRTKTKICSVLQKYQDKELPLVKAVNKITGALKTNLVFVRQKTDRLKMLLGRFIETQNGLPNVLKMKISTLLALKKLIRRRTRKQINVLLQKYKDKAIEPIKVAQKIYQSLKMNELTIKKKTEKLKVVIGKLIDNTENLPMTLKMKISSLLDLKRFIRLKTQKQIHALLQKYKDKSMEPIQVIQKIHQSLKMDELLIKKRTQKLKFVIGKLIDNTENLPNSLKMKISSLLSLKRFIRLKTRKQIYALIQKYKDKSIEPIQIIQKIHQSLKMDELLIKKKTQKLKFVIGKLIDNTENLPNSLKMKISSLLSLKRFIRLKTRKQIYALIQKYKDKSIEPIQVIQKIHQSLKMNQLTVKKKTEKLKLVIGKLIDNTENLPMSLKMKISSLLSLKRFIRLKTRKQIYALIQKYKDKSIEPVKAIQKIHQSLKIEELIMKKKTEKLKLVIGKLIDDTSNLPNVLKIKISSILSLKRFIRLKTRKQIYALIQKYKDKSIEPVKAIQKIYISLNTNELKVGKKSEKWKLVIGKIMDDTSNVPLKLKMGISSLLLLKNDISSYAKKQINVYIHKIQDNSLDAVKGAQKIYQSLQTDQLLVKTKSEKLKQVIGKLIDVTPNLPNELKMKISSMLSSDDEISSNTQKEISVFIHKIQDNSLDAVKGIQKIYQSLQTDQLLVKTKSEKLKQVIGKLIDNTINLPNDLEMKILSILSSEDEISSNAQKQINVFIHKIQDNSLDPIKAIQKIYQSLKTDQLSIQTKSYKLKLQIGKIVDITPNLPSELKIKISSILLTKDDISLNAQKEINVLIHRIQDNSLEPVKAIQKIYQSLQTDQLLVTTKSDKLKLIISKIIDNTPNLPNLLEMKISSMLSSDDEISSNAQKQINVFIHKIENKSLDPIKAIQKIYQSLKMDQPSVTTKSDKLKLQIGKIVDNTPSLPNDLKMKISSILSSENEISSNTQKQIYVFIHKIQDNSLDAVKGIQKIYQSLQTDQLLVKTKSEKLKLQIGKLVDITPNLPNELKMKISSILSSDDDISLKTQTQINGFIHKIQDNSLDPIKGVQQIYHSLKTDQPSVETKSDKLKLQIGKIVDNTPNLPNDLKMKISSILSSEDEISSNAQKEINVFIHKIQDNSLDAIKAIQKIYQSLQTDQLLVQTKSDKLKLVIGILIDNTPNLSSELKIKLSRFISSQFLIRKKVQTKISQILNKHRDNQTNPNKTFNRIYQFFKTISSNQSQHTLKKSHLFIGKHINVKSNYLVKEMIIRRIIKIIRIFRYRAQKKICMALHKYIDKKTGLKNAASRIKLAVQSQKLKINNQKYRTVLVLGREIDSDLPKTRNQSWMKSFIIIDHQTRKKIEHKINLFLKKSRDQSIPIKKIYSKIFAWLKNNNKNFQMKKTKHLMIFGKYSHSKLKTKGNNSWLKQFISENFPAKSQMAKKFNFYLKKMRDFITKKKAILLRNNVLSWTNKPIHSTSKKEEKTIFGRIENKDLPNPKFGLAIIGCFEKNFGDIKFNSWTDLHSAMKEYLDAVRNLDYSTTELENIKKALSYLRPFYKKNNLNYQHFFNNFASDVDVLLDSRFESANVMRALEYINKNTFDVKKSVGLIKLLGSFYPKKQQEQLKEILTILLENAKNERISDKFIDLSHSWETTRQEQIKKQPSSEIEKIKTFDKFINLSLSSIFKLKSLANKGRRVFTSDLEHVTMFFNQHHTLLLEVIGDEYLSDISFVLSMLSNLQPEKKAYFKDLFKLPDRYIDEKINEVLGKDNEITHKFVLALEIMRNLFSDFAIHYFSKSPFTHFQFSTEIQNKMAFCTRYSQKITFITSKVKDKINQEESQFIKLANAMQEIAKNGTFSKSTFKDISMKTYDFILKPKLIKTILGTYQHYFGNMVFRDYNKHFKTFFAKFIENFHLEQIIPKFIQAKALISILGDKIFFQNHRYQIKEVFAKYVSNQIEKKKESKSLVKGFNTQLQIKSANIKTLKNKRVFAKIENNVLFKQLPSDSSHLRSNLIEITGGKMARIRVVDLISRFHRLKLKYNDKSLKEFLFAKKVIGPNLKFDTSKKAVIFYRTFNKFVTAENKMKMDFRSGLVSTIQTVLSNLKSQSYKRTAFKDFTKLLQKFLQYKKWFADPGYLFNKNKVNISFKKIYHKILQNSLMSGLNFKTLGNLSGTKSFGKKHISLKRRHFKQFLEKKSARLELKRLHALGKVRGSKSFAKSQISIKKRHFKHFSKTKNAKMELKRLHSSGNVRGSKSFEKNQISLKTRHFKHISSQKRARMELKRLKSLGNVHYKNSNNSSFKKNRLKRKVNFSEKEKRMHITSQLYEKASNWKTGNQISHRKSRFKSFIKEIASFLEIKTNKSPNSFQETGILNLFSSKKRIFKHFDGEENYKLAFLKHVLSPQISKKLVSRGFFKRYFMKNLSKKSELSLKFKSYANNIYKEQAFLLPKLTEFSKRIRVKPLDLLTVEKKFLKFLAKNVGPLQMNEISKLSAIRSKKMRLKVLIHILGSESLSKTSVSNKGIEILKKQVIDFKRAFLQSTIAGKRIDELKYYLAYKRIILGLLSKTIAEQNGFGKIILPEITDPGKRVDRPPPGQQEPPTEKKEPPKIFCCGCICNNCMENEKDCGSGVERKKCLDFQAKINNDVNFLKEAASVINFEPTVNFFINVKSEDGEYKQKSKLTFGPLNENAHLLKDLLEANSEFNRFNPYN